VSSPGLRFGASTRFRSVGRLWAKQYIRVCVDDRDKYDSLF
jgi:hypothetical protein